MGDRAERLVRIVWIAFAVAVAVRTVLRPDTHTVFPIFALAARHWWEGADLYAAYPPLDSFRYPPLFAILLTPFALLGHAAGGILWSWVSMAVYFSGLRRAADDVLWGSWTPRRRALFLALGLLGAVPGLWNAQSNALVVGLVLLGASQALRGRPWPAGALLASAVALKLTPLPLVGLLLAVRPRLAGPVLALTLAAFLVPFLTRPPSTVVTQYRSFAAHLSDASRTSRPNARDVLSAWSPARTRPIPPWYRALQAGTALALLAFCWKKRRAEARSLATLALSLGAAWAMLFGPMVEQATFVFLAPFLAWGVAQRLGILFVVALLLVTVPLPAVALPLGSALFLVATVRWSLRWGGVGG